MTAPCPEEECDATFTGPRAHIDVVEHVSAVHIHGAVASEPAEPTTQQDKIEIRVSPAGFYLDTQALAVRFPGEKHWHLVRPSRIGTSVGLGSELEKLINADWGLLADPAQTTELEELRARLDTLKLDFNSSEEDLTDARREIAEVRRYLIDNWYRGAPVDGTLMLLIGAVKQIQRERDQRQARIDRALVLLQDAPGMELTRVGIDAVRAALVGDQPPTDEPKPRVWVHGAEANPERISPREAVETGVGLRNDTGHVWHFHNGGWQFDGKRAEQRGRDRRWGFWALLEHCGRLTEVPPALSGVALREVEEADDAAEPACECFVVPEEQWTRHYDATEPGSMVEQNPDCRVHPTQQTDAAGDLP